MRGRYFGALLDAPIVARTADAARAAEPRRSVRLVYDPPPSSACPDESSFRDLVAAGPRPER